jgi:hypothetical protein
MRASLGRLLTALVLAGCGGGATTSSLPGSAAAASLSTSAAVRAVTAHPDRRRSWISPEAKAKELLFVSDAGTADVYMYQVPTLKLVGTITGFDQPQGECSDTKGNVWITDTNAQTIYEVSHQGRLENTLADPDGYPVGCAWNPKNGDVAVMNLFGLDGAQGGVLIYPTGSKPPTEYTNPKQYYYNFGGYDNSGNLFLDGRESGVFVLSELAAGAKSAKTIKVTGAKIYFPGMVQWEPSSSELLVGDQQCGDVNASCIYQLTLGTGGATVSGTTKLENAAGGSVCDLVQGVEADGEILGSDFEFCGYTPSTTEIWPYPAGGTPSAENSTTDNSPVGAALSVEQQPQNRRAPPGRSWMRPGTSGEDLVYVSDADGEVTVYDYTTMDLVGVLANFVTPTGECVDKTGNVYIADAGKKVIHEYAHGGTKSLKTLNDSPYVPNACSVDPTTGDLAVANSSGTGSASNIAVYTHASGQPTLYTDSSVSDFQACAYNSTGTLFATGTQGSTTVAYFAWLSKQLSKLISINVPGPKPSWEWYYVSGIQWDGKFFALDDDGIYRIALIHGQAYYVGETAFNARYLTGRAYGIYDPNPKEQGTQVLVGYAQDYSSGVDYFSYPGGGSSQGSFSHGVDDPYDIVISLKK